MELSEYRRFVEHLVETARTNSDVIGLVALGSTADASRAPDVWSDHDVWVVVRDGLAETLRDDPSWLPDAERIVGYYPETKHGRSVVYDDGHLLELAVFDDQELEITKANDYRVLYDAGGIEPRLAAIAARTLSERAPAPGHAAGRFVTQVLIGMGRYGRGELLSANQLIRELAVSSLLEVVAATMPSTDPGVLDNIDPRRRFEMAYPGLAARIDQKLGESIVDLAQTLVDLAAELEAPGVEAAQGPTLAALQAAIDRARRARPPSPTLHHVQLAMVAGREDLARRFYGNLIGLNEVVKPAVLVARGGVWFRGPTIEIHLGVEDPFRAAEKAHPGIRVGDIDALAERLQAAGHGVRWDDDFPGHRRFYTNDPFGNRVEFLQPE